MELAKQERETIIIFNEAEKDADVYTHNDALRQRLERLAREFPGECRLVKTSHDGEAVDYTVPKSWVQIRRSRGASVCSEALFPASRA